MDRLGITAATVAAFGLGVAATLMYQRETAPTPREVAGQSSPRAVAASGLTADPRPVDPAIVGAPASPVATPAAPSKSSARAVRAPEYGSSPIPITAGFEHVFAAEDGADADLNPVIARHAKLQAEARDTAWAESTERDISSNVQDFLDQRGIDRHDLELPVVRCGATLCEIQAVGQADGSSHDWQTVLPQMIQGSLGQDFNARNAMTIVFELPSGQSGYVTFLTRKVNHEKVGAPRRA